MRAAQQAAIDALALANPCTADLWTVVLPQGTQRWTSGDRDVTLGADTWLRSGPVIGHGEVLATSGIEVSTLDVELKGQFRIGGIPIAALAATGSFDDASVTFDRLYLPSWATTPTTNHRIRLFFGHVYQPEPESTVVRLVVKDPRAKADDELPRRTAGPMCPWTWGDARCGVNKTLWQATDAVAGGSTAQDVVLVTGTSVFLVKGALLTFSDGQRRVVQAWNAGTKTATIDSPLPAVPSGAVTIQRGCDKTMAACGTPFANLVRFGGFPAIPRKS